LTGKERDEFLAGLDAIVRDDGQDD
jgi:hypothetical protein